MKFQRSFSQQDDARIDITSMIDVVFQLLIFFMVTTSFVAAPGLSVDLPKASSNDVVREEKDLVVTITKESAIKLGSEPVDLGELESRFSQEAGKNANTLVVIQADQSVEHGVVVRIMDLARQAGLLKLAIATEPVKGGDK